MWYACKRYLKSCRPITLLVLAILSTPSFSQEYKITDTIAFGRRVMINHAPVDRAVFNRITSPEFPLIPVPAKAGLPGKNPVLLDSLKVKASKYLITKALYDFIIVSEENEDGILFSGSSDLSYRKYSGKLIRKIDIRRLDVFGTNINNPYLSNPSKGDNLLNRTHLNTNEFIIRKNLLFTEGDTVSPLLLSDNERILRQLPYIDDSRIMVVPVSDDEVDIIVVTRDVYSLGASFDYSSIKKGKVGLIEKNTVGIGHEFRIDIPYNGDLENSPGFGIMYNIDNIVKTFINLSLFYYDGLGNKTYGFSLDRKLVSSATKYAGGISIRELISYTKGNEDYRFNLQDYWLSRSFLLSKTRVNRIILGTRYTNNNHFDNSFLFPDPLQYKDNYNIFLGSIAYSAQKYHKTNLIYGYGKTEDIPYGGLINVTVGKEIQETGDRIYSGATLSLGHSIGSLGYFFTSAGISTFFNDKHTEQGLLLLRTSYFSSLAYVGKYRLRTFINVDYTRGFDRGEGESLSFIRDNGFSGFRNDSVGGEQRLAFGLESVLFSPIKLYGFRFAFFAFADFGYLFGTNEFVYQGVALSSIGLGVRVRNDNLILNTLQIRVGFFPNLPGYSSVNYFTVSGEQLLKPDNFDPGPPGLLPYR
jgi:hypothetical protein